MLICTECQTYQQNTKVKGEGGKKTSKGLFVTTKNVFKKLGRQK